MSKQDGTQPSTKRRKSSTNNSTAKQNGLQTPTPQRPANDDREGWERYWKVQGKPWRTEPEIDEERQKYLSERRSMKPNIEQGIYPFKDIKLSRADVEWLLATHEKGRGPIVWSDESQRHREGLDLRGADLRKVNLQSLPLSRMQGGLGWDDVMNKDIKIPYAPAAIHLEEANLEDAHLERSNFCGAHLEGASFINAHLQRAYLYQAHLEGCDFLYTNLRKADLSNTYLEGSYFAETHLEGVYLFEAHLERACMEDTHLEEAFLMGAHLEGAELRNAHLEGVNLRDVHLEGKIMADDDLARVLLWVEDEMFPKILPPASLKSAFLNSATRLDGITLGNRKHGFVSLIDVSWDNVNLAVVDWTDVNMLGDEKEARQRVSDDKKIKDKGTQLLEYSAAVRANRQLAMALQTQGMNEEAARFAYRAQMLQRTVYRLQKKFWQYFVSLILDLLSGYGYKAKRSLLAYLLVITVFATTYFIIGRTVGPALSPLGAWIFSMTSFHGRGFFPGGIGLDDSLTVLAALEAFVGLLIEVTFIATLTQRFFGK